MSKQIFYKSGYLYQLVEPYRDTIPIKPPKDIITDYITLTVNGALIVAKGYAFDGPSGPTIDTPSAMRGSLIHDCGYQLLRLGLVPQSTRPEWDALYERCCLEDGMWPVRAYLHFKALRGFGARAADPESERPILVAP